MGTTKQTKKFLIYLPLIIAGVLCIAKIFEGIANYVSFNGELETGIFNYVFRWNLFVAQFMICLLPVCFIFFQRYNKKYLFDAKFFKLNLVLYNILKIQYSKIK